MRAVGKVRKVRGFNGARITKGEPTMNPNITPEEMAHKVCRSHFHNMGVGEYVRRLPTRPDWQLDEKVIAEAIQSAQRPLQQRIEELEKVLGNLVIKVDSTKAETARVCILADVHGMPYNGPMFDVEMKIARQALNPKSEGSEED